MDLQGRLSPPLSVGQHCWKCDVKLPSICSSCHSIFPLRAVGHQHWALYGPARGTGPPLNKSNSRAGLDRSFSKERKEREKNPSLFEPNLAGPLYEVKALFCWNNTSSEGFKLSLNLLTVSKHGSIALRKAVIPKPSWWIAALWQI